MDAVFEQPVETDKYWVDDKHRTEVLQAETDWMMESRAGNLLAERTLGEPRTADSQTDRYWTDSRHMERQWTVDRHTQRQIDRKIERQWMGGRQIERSWSESRPVDLQVDNQWTESRNTGRDVDRQVQALHLAQRPLPPYPSDRTPSPKQEGDPLKSTELAAIEWHPQVDGGGSTDGWRSSGEAGGVPASRKPEPPPQSSKPNVSRLRPRHRRESSDALPGIVIHVDALLIMKQIFFLTCNKPATKTSESGFDDRKLSFIVWHRGGRR